jgi:hypothetical protein
MHDADVVVPAWIPGADLQWAVSDSDTPMERM